MLSHHRTKYLLRYRLTNLHFTSTADEFLRVVGIVKELSSISRAKYQLMTDSQTESPFTYKPFPYITQLHLADIADGVGKNLSDSILTPTYRVIVMLPRKRKRKPHVLLAQLASEREIITFTNILLL